MPDPELQEQIAAATAYEMLHVPALFLEWADPVLDAAQVESGQRVLDVASGTESERVLAAFVDPAGQVVFDSPAHIVTCRKT